MSNFDDLTPGDRMPDDIKQRLKQQTMGNIHTARMILDVVDLFFVKAATTLSQSISPPTDVYLPSDSETPEGSKADTPPSASEEQDARGKGPDARDFPDQAP